MRNIFGNGIPLRCVPGMKNVIPLMTAVGFEPTTLIAFTPRLTHHLDQISQIFGTKRAILDTNLRLLLRHTLNMVRLTSSFLASVHLYYKHQGTITGRVSL